MKLEGTQGALLPEYLTAFDGLIGDQRTWVTFGETVKGIIGAGSLACQRIAASSAILSAAKEGGQRVSRMATGESKTVIVPAVDAFGESYPDMVTSVAREMFPADVEPAGRYVASSTAAFTAATSSRCNVRLSSRLVRTWMRRGRDGFVASKRENSVWSVTSNVSSPRAAATAEKSVLCGVAK